jgi:hypothetical protein
MSSEPGQEAAAERILDFALYAPVGLVLSLVEAVPGLVRKGRARLAPQVGVARTVGEFTVRQGYRQVVGLAASRGGFPFRPVHSPANSYDVYTPEPAVLPGDSNGNGNDDAVRDGEAPVAVPVEVVETGGVALSAFTAGELAIPSYDSLSATQVVQRLAGLSREEVAAVAAYEAGTRRRKTVLSRAEQLLR